MTEPSVKCDEIQEMAIDMLFRLPDGHDVFEKLIEDFCKPLSLNRL
jgi:hypothetical protein